MRLEKEQDLLRHLKEDACLPVYLCTASKAILYGCTPKTAGKSGPSFFDGFEFHLF